MRNSKRGRNYNWNLPFPLSPCTQGERGRGEEGLRDKNACEGTVSSFNPHPRPLSHEYMGEGSQKSLGQEHLAVI
jgi:hypothetical protein